VLGEACGVALGGLGAAGSASLLGCPSVAFGLGFVAGLTTPSAGFSCRVTPALGCGSLELVLLSGSAGVLRCTGGVLSVSGAIGSSGRLALFAGFAPAVTPVEPAAVP